MKDFELLSQREEKGRAGSRPIISAMNGDISPLLSSALTDRSSSLFVCRFGGGMWKDHSAIPQEGLGWNRLSSGGGDGE